MKINGHCDEILISEESIFFDTRNEFYSEETRVLASQIIGSLKREVNPNINMTRLGGTTIRRLKMKKDIKALKTSLESDYIRAKHLLPDDYDNAVAKFLEYHGSQHQRLLMGAIIAIWKDVCDKALKNSDNVSELRTITPIFGDILETAASLSYQKVLDTINVNEVFPRDFIDTDNFCKSFLLRKYQRAIEVGLN